MSLTHQVRVVDNDGLAINGSMPVEVSLWDHASATGGANQLWAHGFSANLIDGYVSVVLATNGAGDDVQAEWFAQDVWVQVAVDSVVFGNRQRITTVPRSATTHRANGQLFSSPLGGFELVENPTSFVATTELYTGNISYTDLASNSWIGRPATTAICQDLMGSGARLCHNDDVARLIATGVVNSLNENDPNKMDLPSGHIAYWVSSGGGTDLYQASTAHNYGDCHHFTTSSSASRGTAIIPVQNGLPYGNTQTQVCNISYPLLCCR